MSYCRFSSDDFTSDVYCFPDIRGGYTTIVAHKRRVPGRNDRFDDYMAGLIDETEYERLHELAYEAIALPHAGGSFNDSTLESFKRRLLMLRELGYRVPQSALDRIERELAIQGNSLLGGMA